MRRQEDGRQRAEVKETDGRWKTASLGRGKTVQKTDGSQRSEVRGQKIGRLVRHSNGGGPCGDIHKLYTIEEKIGVTS